MNLLILQSAGEPLFYTPFPSLEGTRPGHNVWQAADAWLTSVTQVLHQTLPCGTVTVFLVTNNLHRELRWRKAIGAAEGQQRIKRGILHADIPCTTVKGETKSQMKEK